MTDLATALYAHGAILAALYHRTTTGQGQWLQCNLLATQVRPGHFLSSTLLLVKRHLRAGTDVEDRTVEK